MDDVERRDRVVQRPAVAHRLDEAVAGIERGAERADRRRRQRREGDGDDLRRMLRVGRAVAASSPGRCHRVRERLHRLALRVLPPLARPAGDDDADAVQFVADRAPERRQRVPERGGGPGPRQLRLVDRVQQQQALPVGAEPGVEGCRLLGRVVGGVHRTCAERLDAEQEAVGRIRRRLSPELVRLPRSRFREEGDGVMPGQPSPVPPLLLAQRPPPDVRVGSRLDEPPVEIDVLLGWSVGGHARGCRHVVRRVNRHRRFAVVSGRLGPDDLCHHDDGARLCRAYALPSGMPAINGGGVDAEGEAGTACCSLRPCTCAACACLIRSGSCSGRVRCSDLRPVSAWVRSAGELGRSPCDMCFTS